MLASESLPCNAVQGLSGGCGLAVQALVAAVAVGELALCNPPPGTAKSPQPAGDGTAPPPPSPGVNDGDEPAAPGAAAAMLTDTQRSSLLPRLLGCSLELAEQAQKAIKSPGASEAGPAAAGRSGSTAGSRQRRLEDRAADAQLRASQAAGSRLMVTALAGLAGLTSGAAAAAAANQRPAASGAAPGPAPQHPASALHRKRMWFLLRNSADLAVEALSAADQFPELAADFIEVLPLLMLGW